MYKKNSNKVLRFRANLKKVFLLAFFVIVSNLAIAQVDRKVTMAKSQTTVGVAFKSIEQQTGLKFSYDGTFDLLRRVKLPTNSTPLSRVMETILTGTNREYSINGNFILIKQPKATEPQPTAYVPTVKYIDLPTGSIEGYVLVEGGRYIYNATVTATEKATPNKQAGNAYSDYTSNEGLFLLSGLPYGSYVLRATHPDYGTAEQQFNVSEKKAQPIVIAMTPSVVEQIKPVAGSHVATTIPTRSFLNGADQGAQFKTPRWAIKTNLLHDATTTINLGLEFRVGRRLTIDLPVSYNPWTFSGNTKIKNFIVQPELRRWFNEPFNGHFIGFNAIGAYYNIGGVKIPLMTLDKLENNRYEGNLWGAGISYGYQWMLSNRLSMEATFGLGYAYINYKETDCITCGYWQSEGVKHYFGPTKLGLSLSYIIR